MSLRWIERLTLVVVFVCALVPIAARTEYYGLPLYGIPLFALYMLWAWRSLHTVAFRPSRSTIIIPFLLVALLLGLSTLLVASEAADAYAIWATGLLLLVYANQNWQVTIDFRLLAQLAIVLLSIEIFVALLQIGTRSYVGNAVMYFGQSGGVAENVGLIAGGRVFRPVGTFGLPNLLSIFIVVISALLVPVIAGAAGFSAALRVYAAVLVLSGFLVLVYSTSRGNILAMLGLPFVFYLMYVLRTMRLAAPSRRTGLYVLSGVVFVLACGFIAVIGLREAGASEFIQGLLFRLEGVEESARFRFLQYWTALSALVEFPFLGMGFGQSHLVWEIVELDFPGKEDFAFPPHNAYIVLALEGGLLAGLLYAGTMQWLSLIHPIRQLVREPGRYSAIDFQADALFIAFLMFAISSLIYIVPLTRSLWPLGCFLIGLMPALRMHGGRA